MSAFIYPKPVPPDTRPTVRECERKVIEAAKAWAAEAPANDLFYALANLQSAERLEMRKAVRFHVVKTGCWGLIGFVNGRPKWTRGNGARWRKADAERIAPLIGGTLRVSFS